MFYVLLKHVIKCASAFFPPSHSWWVERECLAEFNFFFCSPTCFLVVLYVRASEWMSEERVNDLKAFWLSLNCNKSFWISDLPDFWLLLRILMNARVICADSKEIIQTMRNRDNCLRSVRVYLEVSFFLELWIFSSNKFFHSLSTFFSNSLLMDWTTEKKKQENCILQLPCYIA